MLIYEFMPMIRIAYEYSYRISIIGTHSYIGIIFLKPKSDSPREEIEPAESITISSHDYKRRLLFLSFFDIEKTAQTRQRLTLNDLHWMKGRR